MKHHRNMANTALNRPIYAHLKLHEKNFSIFSIAIIDTICHKQYVGETHNTISSSIHKMFYIKRKVIR